MFYRNINLISFPFELDILLCISAQSNILFGACFIADGETALQFCDVGAVICNIGSTVIDGSLGIRIEIHCIVGSHHTVTISCRCSGYNDSQPICTCRFG